MQQRSSVRVGAGNDDQEKCPFKPYTAETA